MKYLFICTVEVVTSSFAQQKRDGLNYEAQGVVFEGIKKT